MLHDIPEDVEWALRAEAEASGRSLDETLIEVIGRGLASNGRNVRRRDLSDIAGSWAEDPDMEAALADFERV